jgi:hypothetical protein
VRFRVTARTLVAALRLLAILGAGRTIRAWVSRTCAPATNAARRCPVAVNGPGAWIQGGTELCNACGVRVWGDWRPRVRSATVGFGV